jgi:hypothetical protein
MGASEEVVEDNCCGPSSFSWTVKFALLGSMSDITLKWVRAPSRSRRPPKVENEVSNLIMHLEVACKNSVKDIPTMSSYFKWHDNKKRN